LASADFFSNVNKKKNLEREKKSAKLVISENKNYIINNKKYFEGKSKKKSKMYKKNLTQNAKSGSVYKLVMPLWVMDFVMTLFTTGVSNSNLSEGLIPKKKCSSGHSLLEKAFEGRKLIFPL
jgi:hypothetical protein